MVFLRLFLFLALSLYALPGEPSSLKERSYKVPAAAGAVRIDYRTSLLASSRRVISSHAQLGRYPPPGVQHEYFTKVTAYTSRRCETDSTPFETASGSRVRHGVVATNHLPFGTRLRFPDLWVDGVYYGNTVFVVEDRMNPRYSNRIDIWVGSLHHARQFGVRKTRVQILRQAS